MSATFGLQLCYITATIKMVSRSRRYMSKKLKHPKPKWAALAQRVAGLIDGPLDTATETQFTDSVGIVAEIGRSTSKSEVISILTGVGCSDLTERLDMSQCTKLPIAGGGLGDIYKGRLDSGTVVAIKCARPHTIETDMDHMQNTAHEIYIWSKCKHENIMDLFGLAQFNSLIAIISPWMENGVLPDYLRENPSLDRCRICTQVATGLAYLHQTGVVHGDVKGSNILISDDGTPKLADFGNACLTEYTIAFSRLPVYTQSLRWSAPEICGQEALYSREGDVYALAMTVLEIITGQVPRSHIRNDVRIMVVVAVKHEIPARPVDLIPAQSRHGDLLWSLLERCWATNPMDRPGADIVKDTLALVNREGLVDEEIISSDHAAIFARLVDGGCPDLTKVLDQTRCYKIPVTTDEPFSHRGVLLDGTEVSLRPLDSNDRPPHPPRETIAKSAAEELFLWSTCKHKNILPLLGVAVVGSQIMTVYPWTRTSTVFSYLFRHPATNRCHMCLELARGIMYLHNLGLIQRGMDPTSVRVTEGGTITLLACSNVVIDIHRLRLVRSRHDPQREAPDLIDAMELYDTKSDMHALGMMLFELTTNEGLLSSTRTRSKSANKRLPVRPKDIPSSSRCGDQFWLLLNRCWASNPQDRPDASMVVEKLEVINDEELYGAKNGVSTRPAFIHPGVSKVDVIQSITGHVCPVLEILVVEPAPFARGDITDVYEGRLGDGTVIALSTWRHSGLWGEKQNFEAYNLFAQQVYTWSKCDHINVLKLLGIAEVRGELAMVTPRVETGSMPSYIQTTQTQANRCKMSAQIAGGVAYLHSIGVVHGNIQGSKVLVSEDETVKLCDFYSAFLRHSSLHFMTRTYSYFSTRWAAPELLAGVLEASEQADVWALGMTILECITGERPFSEIEAEHDVLNAVHLMRKVPARPRKHIPPNSVQGNTLWNILIRCWSYEPSGRPSASEVRDIITTITPGGLVDPNQIAGDSDIELHGSWNSDFE